MKLPIIRLSKLKCVGLALSIFWAFGAGLYTHNADVERAENFAKFAYKVCSDNKAITHNPDLSTCLQEREVNLKTWMEGSTGNVAFAALAPIPFGWLGAFILLYVIRAQIFGFRAVVPWATMSWPKKAFVSFCVLASFITVLFGLTVILNLYADTQVPVALGSLTEVIKTGDDLVYAEGTWTRSGSTEGSSMGYPLQTSKINCNKNERRCTEARALVSGNALMSDLLEYDIENWTSAAIVFRNDSLCATEVFTIDLNTKAVSGAGHRINKDNYYCKIYGGNEESWKYQLSNGFKVYWEQRQRARPLPLRLIQTFFGN